MMREGSQTQPPQLPPPVYYILRIRAKCLFRKVSNNLKILGSDVVIEYNHSDYADLLTPAPAIKPSKLKIVMLLCLSHQSFSLRS